MRIAGKRRSRRRRLAFAGVALLLATGLAEGLLRLAGFPRGFVRSTVKLWVAEEERVLGPFRPEAEVTIAWPPELAYTVRTNALGLRGPPPRGGLPVVLCLGDSTTFGSHVGEEETYPYLLDRRLRALGVEATALNAGAPRFTITDEVELLERAIPKLRPRAVLLLFCGNDLYELGRPRASERARRRASLLSTIAGELALTEAVLFATLNARRGWLKARGEWPRPLRPDQRRTEAQGDEPWERWAAHLLRARAVSAAGSARLFVAAFPGCEEVERAEPCEIERRLPAITAATGVDYVDLYPSFRRIPAREAFLLPHDAHATRAGNDVIARVFAEAVAPVFSGSR